MVLTILLSDIGAATGPAVTLMVDERKESSRILLIAVQDDLVDQTRQTIDSEVGGLAQPDTGVLFGLPISFFDGKLT